MTRGILWPSCCSLPTHWSVATASQPPVRLRLRHRSRWRVRCRRPLPNGTNIPADLPQWRRLKCAHGFPASSIPSISRRARSSSRETSCSSSIRALIGSPSSKPRPMWNARRPSSRSPRSTCERATPLVRSQTVTEREFDTRQATQREAAARSARRSGIEAGRAQSRMDRGARAHSRAHLR